MKPYRPSNGTEGAIFAENHCLQCINCDPDPCGEKQCNIWARTLLFDIGSPEYPREWCYVDDKPTCTSWVKWDWDNNGNPDDTDNPNTPVPYDPNQLMLFSEADEILKNSDVKEFVNQN